ncbi:hypothetical protein [Candidatus Methylocalor cossyra]|uniref:Uncharacterized protein n=1 Tax=Candidatus Methylocalor cossyra TaxID=3108543 RepID=A0ABM9NE15_9GAMM
MAELSKKDRLRVMEMAAGIVAEAAGQTHTTETLEQRLESLYRTMLRLLAEGQGPKAAGEDDSLLAEDDD